MVARPLPHTRPVPASAEHVAHALAARGYDERFVAVRPEGAAVAVWYLGNAKLDSNRRGRASVLAMLAAWGLEVAERGWTVVVTGTLTPTAEDLRLAADAAMTKALLAEHGGDRALVRDLGRVECVDGRLRIWSQHRDTAVSLAARLVVWVARATGLEATVGAAEGQRGGAVVVPIHVEGLRAPAQKRRCPRCDGDSVVTGAPCEVCGRTGYVLAA